MLMTTVVVVVLTALLAASASAVTPKPAWFWTETVAERTVVQRVLIPCARVRKLPRCSIPVAQRRVEQRDAAVATCQASADPVPCMAAFELMPDPRVELRHVTRGFPVETAECVGGGKTDSGGFRFTQFRCKVTVDDYNWLSDRVLTVAGRIVVYVTGARTFRFAVIP